MASTDSVIALYLLLGPVEEEEYLRTMVQGLPLPDGNRQELNFQEENRIQKKEKSWKEEQEEKDALFQELEEKRLERKYKRWDKEDENYLLRLKYEGEEQDEDDEWEHPSWTNLQSENVCVFFFPESKTSFMKNTFPGLQVWTLSAASLRTFGLHGDFITHATEYFESEESFMTA